MVGLVEDGDLDLAQVAVALLIRSSSRPGQARRCRRRGAGPATCGFWPTPPKTVWVVRPTAVASGSRASSIWPTSSRVGARIRARGAVGAGRAAGGDEAGDQRQQERVGLAGAGAAAAEDVAPGQRVGQRRGLDGGGLGDAAGREDADQLGGDAELGEAVGRRSRGRACGQKSRRQDRNHSRVVCLTTLVPSATELEKRSLREGGAPSGLRAGDRRGSPRQDGAGFRGQRRHRTGPSAIRARGAGVVPARCGPCRAGPTW